ncbi:flippase-like domain-containing protein [Niveibacterium sp. 24ML]|uniref:lysylphosphatidylglycerol synthase transmembrane domain-containing protein n=1 Tax=Niveibacterium sp. 24ML TaxID=2985512 RepID=UPI00226FAB2A|nr:lysylphosphatidylglycerol synthase transmembrane domain-containing protein [Niveibacterium sp. 24ML]MCX9156580.1 flippase-like domain-containing protein [Niveibacterium sp. 24ML]
MKRLLALAISLALLAWLAHSGDWRAVGERLGSMPWSVLALALSGFLLSYLLRAARMSDEFVDVSRGHFWAMARVTTAHNAAINVVPFRGGEIALPVLLQREFGVPMGRALVSLLWLRMQDAFVVLLLAAWVWPGLDLAIRVLWSLGVLLSAWAVPAWARAHPANVAEQTGWRGKLGKLRLALAHSTRGAVRSWAWTLANWLVKLSAQTLLLTALLGRSDWLASAGVLGGELAAILPVQGVAGFGTYEAGVAAALVPHGITLANGLQAALALHLVIIATAVSAGALAYAALPTGPRPVKANGTTS